LTVTTAGNRPKWSYSRSGESLGQEIRSAEKLIHDVMKFKLVAAPVFDSPIRLKSFELPPIFDI